jgi:hypothetical protein
MPVLVRIIVAELRTPVELVPFIRAVVLTGDGRNGEAEQPSLPGVIPLSIRSAKSLLPVRAGISYWHRPSELNNRAMC